MPDGYLEDRQTITARLKLLGARPRRSNGETWWDHHCQFHQDNRTSASWQEETGIYYCRTEDRRYSVPECLVQMDLPRSEHTPAPVTRARRLAGTRRLPSQAPAAPTASSNGYHGTPDATYEYYFPDGKLSHRKHRIGDGESKQIWQEGPNGEASLPQELWPVYGDFGLLPNAALVVVEGEKAVDRVTALQDRFRDQPIRALTCGSSNDLRRHAQVLADRIAGLQPSHLLLWPDHDDPGQKGMEALAKVLRPMGLVFATVKPSRYDLPPKAGADDYLDAGGSLATAFADHLVQPQVTQLDTLVRRLPVTLTQHFLWPGTRRLARISTDMAKSLWFGETGAIPTPRMADELALRLRQKAMIDPTEVVYRGAADQDGFWWRPASDGKCWHVTAKGLEYGEDPKGVILLMPSERPDYPVDVDQSGTREDLEELCSRFRLNKTEVAMIEGWMVAVLTGLQAPIILMRSPAGTGKSTLARFLVSVLEPIVPYLDVKERGTTDQRELIRVLERSSGLILDNVSRMSGEMEDLLSKLVTGMTVGIRSLYEDSVSMLRMKRGIIVTTTNWDVYKGDLASRMVVVEPATQTVGQWMGDAALTSILGPLVPKIRGHIFNQCARYYRQRTVPPATNSFRVGDLGMIFEALGYDVDELARKEAEAKSEVISINDPWLEALVELWKEEDASNFLKTTNEICTWLEDFGCDNVPHPKNPRLSRWLGEKAPIFRDHGFAIEAVRSNAFRGYRFTRVQNRTEPE